MESKILLILAGPQYTALTAPELLPALALPPAQLPALQRVLAQLERTGRVARIKDDRFVLPLDADLVPGRIRINRQGKGFVQCDAPGEREITIPEHATSTAFNGDRVLARLDVVPAGKRGDQGERTGKVIRILERARTQLVGTLRHSEKFLYVIPDDPRIPHDIYVTPFAGSGPQPQAGDKVLVDLRAWESRHVSPEGEIVEVLGAPAEPGVDMLSVLRQYRLADHFPERVLAEAVAIGQEIRSDELAGRTDCRHHPVVTIDPDDAKDFDDAICLQPAPNGQWKLWVHIADVSHYVRPGSALDTEARQRGNSTYLVDRVIPMLPEGLSNELCSLKPRVDRLTKCVEFLLAADGRVVRTQFYPAVIHSQRRFSYQEALAVLQGEPADPIEKMLHQAHEVAQLVRRARFTAGSLEMDFPETKIRLDDQGRVLRIERHDNDVSHQLIEEFMLLANEAVAARLMALNRPAVYRVHEAPDERRLREYRAEVMAHHLPCGNLTVRTEVQKLLRKLTTVPIGAALKIGFLRSLMRARYAVEPLGHYGLAKKKYTHFTSPIRRYADLLVHRALFGESDERLGASALHEIADQLSTTERDSADAERDSKDVKMYAFLEEQLAGRQPPTYAGLVTDVRNFGFFVDVTDLGLSGAVPLSSIKDDFYQFDGMRSRVIGRRSRRIIQLGDRVTVQVAKVDRFKKQVDFKLATGVAVVTPADRVAAPASQRRPDRQTHPRRPDVRPAAGVARPARPVARPAAPPNQRPAAPPPGRTAATTPKSGHQRPTAAPAKPKRSPGRPGKAGRHGTQPRSENSRPGRNETRQPQAKRGASRPPQRPAGPTPGSAEPARLAPQARPLLPTSGNAQLRGGNRPPPPARRRPSAPPPPATGRTSLPTSVSTQRFAAGANVPGPRPAPRRRPEPNRG